MAQKIRGQFNTGTKEHRQPSVSMPSRKGIGRAIGVIDLSVFAHAIPVFISDVDRCHEARKRGFNPEPSDTWHNGLVSVEDTEDGRFLVCLVITPEGDYGTIVHEASHIVDFIFERLGISPGVESTETRAYLLDYIFEETSHLIKVNKARYPHLYGLEPTTEG